MSAPSHRAPLLALLLPIMAAYALCDVLDWQAANALLLALPFLLASLALAYFSKPHKVWPLLWLACLCITVFCLGLAYHRMRIPSASWPAGLPPREADLTVKVHRIFHGSSTNRDSGIAQIVGTEPHLRHLEGQWLFVVVPRDMGGLQRQEVISLKGQLEYLPPGEPGSFEEFLHQQGAHLKLYRTLKRETLKPSPWWIRQLSQVRDQVHDTLAAGIVAYTDEVDIYRAMLLGEKGLIDPENKEHFIQTGTFHLFAISGLHVGIIAVSFLALTRLLRIPRPYDHAFSISMVFLYVQMTGASPSSVRAFTMVFFFFLASRLKRQSQPLQALIAAACCSLLWDPRELHSAGFQMSYSVVAGIILWGLPLEKVWRKHIAALSPLKPYRQSRVTRVVIGSLNKLSMALAVSLSAFFSSAPLSIQYFQVLAPGAIPLNILLVPMASLSLIAGFQSSILGLVGLDGCSAFLNHGPLLLIKSMLLCLISVGSIPGAFLDLSWPNQWLGPGLALCFVLCLLAYPRQRRFCWDYLLFPLVFSLLGCIFAGIVITYTQGI